jgi:hypothetical protein
MLSVSRLWQAHLLENRTVKYQSSHADRPNKRGDRRSHEEKLGQVPRKFEPAFSFLWDLFEPLLS